MAKTLRSRIAAVAVAALGIGLLQATPASAAWGDGSWDIYGPNNTSAYSATATVGRVSTIQIYASTSDPAANGADTDTITLSVDSAPTGSSVTTGAAGDYVNGSPSQRPIKGSGAAYLRANRVESLTTTGSAPQLSGGTVSISANGNDIDIARVTSTPTLTMAPVAQVNFTPDLAGTYTMTVAINDAGVDGGGAGTDFDAAAKEVVTITVTAGFGTSSAVLVGSTTRLDLLDSLVSPTADYVNNDPVLQSVGDDGYGNLLFVSGPLTQTAMTPGDVYGRTASGVIDAQSYYGGGIVNYFFDVSTNGLTNGTYVFKAFDDVYNENFLDDEESSTELKVTLAKNAKIARVSISKTTVALNGADVDFGVSVSWQDEDGVTSYRPSVVGETVFDVNGQVGGANENKVIFNWSPTYPSITIDKDAPAGVYTLKLASSSDSTGAYAITQKITVISTGGDVTKLYVSAATGLEFDSTYGGTAPGNEALATTAAKIYASTTAAKSITFKFSGGNYSSGDAINVPITIKASTGTPVTAVTAPAYALIATDGTGSFTITTAAKNGYGYQVQIPDHAGNFFGFEVIYKANYPDFDADSVAPSDEFNAKSGSTTVLSAVLDDTFGAALASKTVTVTVAGRNPGTSQVTTDSTGKASFSLVDAGAVATATADVVTFSYPYIDDNGTAKTATTQFNVEYTATGIVIGAVKVTAAAGAASIDTVQALGKPTIASGAIVLYEASVTDADGLPVAGVIVNWTADADTYLVKSTSKTNTSGVAEVYAFRNKIGYASVTASILGKSDTYSLKKWETAGTNYRNITLTADPATGVVSGATVRFTALVTDRWGNPVEGVEVKIRLTGAGRLVTGEKATDAGNVTGQDGTFQWNVSSLADETGTVTAVATINEGALLQSDDLKDEVNGVVVPGAAAGNYFTTATTSSFKAKVVTADPSITALTAAVASMMTALQNQIATMQSSITLLVTSFSSTVTKLLNALAKKK